MTNERAAMLNLVIALAMVTAYQISTDSRWLVAAAFAGLCALVSAVLA